MIAYDTANGTIGFFSGGPLEVQLTPLTISSNNNRILCVFIRCGNYASPNTITWNNSENMTGGGLVNDDGTYNYYFYYLLNPTAVSADVRVKIGASIVCYVAASVYYNVRQSGEPEDTDFVGDTSDSFTLTSTSTTNNSWIVGTVFCSENRTYETTTGTERIDILEPLFNSDSMALSDNGPINPAGNTSLIGTISSSAAWGGVSAIIAPDSQPTQILARPMYFK